MQTKTNKNGVKLLAVAMVMVMAFAAVAVAVGPSESDAATGDTTYLGGTITGSGDQVFGPGSNVIVEKDLTIPEGKNLVIGGKFTVNEGAELIIKGTLTIQSSASATINADITVEKTGKIYNAAYYDGTNKVNGSFIGFFLNAALVVEKGGEVNGVSTESVANTPGTADDSIKYSAVELTSVDKNNTSNIYDNLIITSTTTAATDTTPEKVTFYLVGASVPYHMNGAGNMGYWVGMQIALPGASTTAHTAKVTYDGRTSNTTETVTDGRINLWFTAGQVIPMTIVYDTSSGKDTVNFTVDTTGCIPAVESGNVPGEIIVNEKGSISMSYSKTSKSTISNQTITVAPGAKVAFNGEVNNVTVRAQQNGIGTYGSVTITSNTPDDALNLTFGAVSEKIKTAFIDTDKTTKATNNVLTISGEISAKYIVTTNNTKALAGALKNLYYAGEKDEKTDVAMTGIVRVAEADSLKITKTGSFIVASGSNFEVAGTMSVTGTKDAQTADQANITLDGIVTVTGKVTIGQYAVTSSDGSSKVGAVNLTIDNSSAVLKVVGDGIISIQDYEMAQDYSNAPGATLGASYTDDDDVFYIMSLPAAIEAAVAADVGEINVWSIPNSISDVMKQDIVLDSDLTVPAGITLVVDAVIVVSEGTTLTFEEDSEIEKLGIRGALIVVKGELYDYNMDDTLAYGVAQSSDASSILINAEVMFIDADETYYRYTTLNSALAGAGNGTTIELFGNVTVKDRLTIGDGITILANGKNLVVENNAELVVDGTLDLVNKRDGTTGTGTVTLYKEVTGKQAGKLTVNGIVVISADFDIKDNNTTGTAPSIQEAPQTVYIAGFYAYGTIGDLADQNFIVAPAVAEENSKTLEDLKVKAETSYSGELKFVGGEDAGEITIVGDTSTTPNIKGKLTVGTLSLTDYSVTIQNGALFNGTIATANGSIKMENIMGGETTNAVVVSDVTDADAGTDVMTIAGAPVKVKADGTFIADDDTTTKNTAKMTIVDGTVRSGTFNASKLVSFNVSEGTVLEIQGTTAVIFTAAKMTVDGTVNVNGNGTLSITDTLTIMGTVNVKAATADDATVGSISASKVYVGLTAKDTVVTNTTTSGADAALNASSVGTMTNLYVLAGATVSEDIVKNVPYTEFYVDDVLWMTAYQSNTSVMINGINTAPVTDANFTKWQANGKDIENTVAIGATGYERVDAVVDYNIYTVRVIADNGIGTVAIDGVVLIKNSNMFVASDLKAGQHTITFELKNGYQGTVKVTFDGSDITDGKFTLSGKDASKLNNSGDYVYDINLSGTSQIEYDTAVDNDNGGMGITDILLIVLVILAAILVVIVALRMMRS